MDAPTNIYGPDGTLCKKGEVIPAGWFDELPDLQTHLDVVASSPTDSAPSEISDPNSAGTHVEATLTATRKRAQAEETP